MNFSGYFLLAAVLVVSTYQSQAGLLRAGINLVGSIVEELESIKLTVEAALSTGSKQAVSTINSIGQISGENKNAYPEANLALAKGYRNCTDLISTAERRVFDTFDAIEKILSEQPESTDVAEELAKKGCQDANELIFAAGLTLFTAQGQALALSNNGAISALIRASQLAQDGGVDSLNGIGLTEKLLLQAISSHISQSLEAAKGAAKTAFAAVYIEIQNSMKEAVQALKDAQRNPIVLKVENQNSAVIANDPAAREAVAKINQAAAIAIQNGANVNLVNELKEVLIIAVGDLAKIAADAKATVEGIQNIANMDPMTAKITFFKKTEEYKVNIGKAAAKIYLALASTALKSGNSLNQEIDRAITAVEIGRTDEDVGLQDATDLIVLGLRHKGNSRRLGIEAAFKCLLYGNKSILQSTAEAANIVFKVLSNN